MALTRKCTKCGIRKSKQNFKPTYIPLNAEAKRIRSTICRSCQLKLRNSPKEKRELELRPYSNRDFILRSIGFQSYQEYLLSEKWQKIRLRVLQLRNFTCELCAGRATQVHHNIYGKKELLGQSLRGMKALCGECHEKIEFSHGRKVGLVEASHRFYQFKRG